MLFYKGKEVVTVQELLTMKEMSELLKVSQPTLINWRKRGMPFKKVGNGIRFEKEKALQWIDEQSVKN